MSKKIFYILAIVLLLLLVGGLIFFFLTRSTQTNQTSVGGFFGFGSSVPTNQTGTSTTNVVSPANNTTTQKVFKIADGPIAGAAFIQTSNPTTTVVRYTMADNGHVLDKPIDVQGAVATPVSNVTIPGIASSIWATTGSSTIMQYADSGVLKSVYIEFGSTTASSSSVTPTRVRFLPNNIVSLAISPTNSRLAYLLVNSNGGVDGFISNLDGTNLKQVFSAPLSQVLLSWPSPSTLLLQTKSAVGVPGVAYSVNATTGVLSPMLYTPGLSATANSTFTKVVYQTSSDSKATTYSHDIMSGKDAPLANNPLPEKCIWSSAPVTNIYCALPVNIMTSNYLDLWHKGFVQTVDSIVNFDTNTGIGSIVALPDAGGLNALIENLTLSPDKHYLMFTARGDQSLWGVHLY
jgi:hypothetical protein